MNLISFFALLVSRPLLLILHLGLSFCSVFTESLCVSFTVLLSVRSFSPPSSSSSSDDDKTSPSVSLSTGSTSTVERRLDWVSFYSSLSFVGIDFKGKEEEREREREREEGQETTCHSVCLSLNPLSSPSSSLHPCLSFRSLCLPNVCVSLQVDNSITRWISYCRMRETWRERERALSPNQKGNHEDAENVEDGKAGKWTDGEEGGNRTASFNCMLYSRQEKKRQADKRTIGSESGIWLQGRKTRERMTEGAWKKKRVASSKGLPGGRQKERRRTRRKQEHEEQWLTNLFWREAWMREKERQLHLLNWDDSFLPHVLLFISLLLLCVMNSSSREGEERTGFSLSLLSLSCCSSCAIIIRHLRLPLSSFISCFSWC